MRRIKLAFAIGLLACPWICAQDPAKVDPQVYKVAYENDYGRVLRVTRAPLSKAPMHEHPDAFIVIALSNAHQKITGADGEAYDAVLKTGDVGFRSATKHEEENLEGTPASYITNELKKPPGTLKGFPVPPELDPVKIDPKHHAVVLENERVRILRTVLETHIKSPMLAHPSYVVAYFTDSHTTMTLADGKVRDISRKAGDADWRDATKHSTENTQHQQAVEFQIELT